MVAAALLPLPSMNSVSGESVMCWVCLSVLEGRRGVKGSSTLKYSHRPLAQALHSLTKQEAQLSDRLCLRCYRLVLGIDHHSHQLNHHQHTFFSIYHQAHTKTTKTAIATNTTATSTTTTATATHSKEEQRDANTEESQTNIVKGGAIGENIEMTVKEVPENGDDSQTNITQLLPSTVNDQLTVVPASHMACNYPEVVGVNCDRQPGTLPANTDEVTQLRETSLPHPNRDTSKITVFGEELKRETRGETSGEVCVGESINKLQYIETNICKPDTYDNDNQIKSDKLTYNNDIQIGFDKLDTISEFSNKEIIKPNVKNEVRQENILNIKYDVSKVSGVNTNLRKGDETEEVPPASSNDIVRYTPRRRKKTTRKWEDFDYYEDVKEECSDNLSIQQQINLNIARRRPMIGCVTCKRDFSTKREFVRHGCQVHRRPGKRGRVTYTCKGCQATFTIRKNYIKHIETCYKNVPVSCNICQVKLPSAAYLPRHLNAFHKGSAVIKKNSLCEECGRGFSRKESLERHQARSHGASYGTHQCPQCNATFSHTAILAEHLRAHRGYPCVECKNKTFSCVSNLLLHRRTHHSTIQPSTAAARQNITHPFHCQPCGKRWKFHASYTYHIRKYHSGDRSCEAVERCGVCREPLTSHKAIIRHARTCSTAAPSSTDTTQAPQTTSLSPGEVKGGVETRSSEGEIRKSPASQNTRLLTLRRLSRSGSRSSMKRAQTRESETVNAANPEEDEPANSGPKGTSGRPERAGERVSKASPQFNFSHLGPSSSTLAPLTTAPLYPAPLTTAPLCPVPLTPASGIVLEALEDLSGDCQFVILVEECLTQGPQQK